MPVAAPATTESAPFSVSVVLPVLDEAASIDRVVRSVFEQLEGRGYDPEVLVVDGGSGDDSAERAAEAGARVVSQPIPGYGAACIRGIEEATGDVIVFMDGDGTYDPAVLPRFIEPLRSGYDLVVGTRRNGVVESGAMPGLHLHVLEPLQNHLFRRWSKFDVSDVRSGMRSITRAAVGRLNLTSTGVEFASEMLVRAAHEDMEIVEVAVPFRPRRGRSRRTARQGWAVIRQLLLTGPSSLFLVPGAVLLLLGLLLEVALLPGPVVVGPLSLDFHYMFVGSAASILGLQLIVLGVFSKTWALVREPAYAGRWIERFHRGYRLERGLGAGVALFLLGLVINTAILWSWLASGRGDLFAVRPAVFGLTFMVMGAEVAFASIFLSVLRSERYGRP